MVAYDGREFGKRARVPVAKKRRPSKRADRSRLPLLAAAIARAQSWSTDDAYLRRRHEYVAHASSRGTYVHIAAIAWKYATEGRASCVASSATSSWGSVKRSRFSCSIDWRVLARRAKPDAHSPRAADLAIVSTSSRSTSPRSQPVKHSTARRPSNDRRLAPRTRSTHATNARATSPRFPARSAKRTSTRASGQLAQCLSKTIEPKMSDKPTRAAVRFCSREDARRAKRVDGCVEGGRHGARRASAKNSNSNLHSSRHVRSEVATHRRTR